MNILKGNETLKIGGDGISSQNQIINEYRLNEESVEFRSHVSNDAAGFSLDQGWRALDRDEVNLHFALRTSVAQWLDESGYQEQRN